MDRMEIKRFNKYYCPFKRKISFCKIKFKSLLSKEM